MKASFKAQVAAVCGILAVGALCFPMPDGGLLVNRLFGKPAQEVTVSETRIAPLIPYHAPQITPAPATPSITLRFHVVPEVVIDQSLSTENWTAGTVEGKTVWQDNQSGMIWGPRLGLSLSSFTNDDLKKAKEACAAETPADVWALPTAAEFDIAKVNGILKMDSDARHRWIGYQEFSGMELPSGRGYVAVSAEKDFSVRCVARSAKAPENGYAEAGNEVTLKAMAE